MIASRVVDLVTLLLLQRPSRARASRVFSLVFILALGAWASANMALGILTNTFKEGGGTDFHSYWYYGHVIRRGADPYMAFFEKVDLTGPVWYVDGSVPAAASIAQPGLMRVPPNTAPIVFFLHLFSYFSWPTAKVLWLAINTTLTLAIPWLALRLLPAPSSRRTALVMAMSFYGLLATRSAIWTGQTTTLVFALMVMTLLLVRRGQWLVPGLAFGLAMSKYSVALPLLLFLLWKRKYPVVAVGAGVQLVGLAGVAFLGKRSPFAVSSDYLAMMRLHVDQPGIHLASLFPGNQTLALAVVALGLLFLLVAILALRLRGKGTGALSPAAQDYYSLFASLTLWTLLIAYHRAPDVQIAFLSIAMIFSALGTPHTWGLTDSHRVWLAPVLVLSIVVLSFPNRLPGQPAGSLEIPVRAVTTVVLAALLIVSAWIAHHTLSAASSPRRAPEHET